MRRIYNYLFFLLFVGVISFMMVAGMASMKYPSRNITPKIKTIQPIDPVVDLELKTKNF